MRKIQPRAPLDAWDSFLKPFYDELNLAPLVELSVWVLDTTHEEVLNQWQSIYDILMAWGTRSSVCLKLLCLLVLRLNQIRSHD